MSQIVKEDISKRKSPPIIKYPRTHGSVTNEDQPPQHSKTPGRKRPQPLSLNDVYHHELEKVPSLNTFTNSFTVRQKKTLSKPDPIKICSETRFRQIDKVISGKGTHGRAQHPSEAHVSFKQDGSDLPHNRKCSSGSESDTFNGSIDFRCPFPDHGDHRRLSSERQKLKTKERMVKTTPVVVEGEGHTSVCLPISLMKDRSMKPCISIRRKKNQPQIPLQSVTIPSLSITLHTTELNSEGKNKSNSQQDSTIQDEQKSKGAVHQLGRSDAAFMENNTSLTDESEFRKGLKVDTVSQCSITGDEQPNWIDTQYVESTEIAETGDGIQAVANEKCDSASMHIFDNWEGLTLSGSLIEIETQAGRQFDFESGADGCFTINSSKVAELSIGDKLIVVNGINVAHFSKLELNSLMYERDTARLLILHNNYQNNDTQTEEDSYVEVEVSGDRLKKKMKRKCNEKYLIPKHHL